MLNYQRVFEVEIRMIQLVMSAVMSPRLKAACLCDLAKKYGNEETPHDSAFKLG